MSGKNEIGTMVIIIDQSSSRREPVQYLIIDQTNVSLKLWCSQTNKMSWVGLDSFNYYWKSDDTTIIEKTRLSRYGKN